MALYTLTNADVACGDPLKYPKRLVNGVGVDLNPLFHWWNKPRGERPLTSWVHITGSIVATNAWGWTVSATLEESPADKGGKRRESSAATRHEKIVLKNPPLQDLAEFEKLKAQLKALHAEHDRQSAEAEQAAKRSREIDTRQDANRRRRWHVRGLAEESRRWDQAENAAKARVKTLDKQIKEVDSKLANYSDRSKYSIDCFALKANQKYLDLPVYDHGAIIK